MQSEGGLLITYTIALIICTYAIYIFSYCLILKLIGYRYLIDKMENNSDDDELKLSESTLKALNEFYAERSLRDELEKKNLNKIDEDWVIFIFKYYLH